MTEGEMLREQSGTVVPDQGRATRPRLSPHVFLLGLYGVLRWALVAVFLITGARKLVNIEDFRVVLLTMGFFPPAVAPMLAYLVPTLEVLAALSLALRRLELGGLLLALFLAAAFAGLHAYLYLKGIVVPCGCAGIRESLTGESHHLVMAILCASIFLAAAVLSAFGARHRPCWPC